MTQNAANQPVDTRRYRTSWRLTFRFDGQRIDLVRRERLEKVAPGTTAVPPVAGKNSGAWIELVDRSGQLLFHRLLHDPFGTRAEHHSPTGPIELHVRRPEPGEFTAIVPDMPSTSDVILYASPTEPERMHEAAREIGRFSLGPYGAGDTQQPTLTGGPQQGPTRKDTPDDQDLRLGDSKQESS